MEVTLINRSTIARLEQLSFRYEELCVMLADPSIVKDNEIFKSLSMECAQIEPIANNFKLYCKIIEDLSSVRAIANSDDFDLKTLAYSEIAEIELRLVEQEKTLCLLLLPCDRYDTNNVFLEIRAGTGGDEAAIFAGNIYSMYLRYSEQRNWKLEIISESFGEHGGYKEIIIRVIGQGAYSRLKFESGTHRVQRVPATEAQGRIHTSTATVAVLPELATMDEIDINTNDLRIDTFRASGAGGQHVNKTDSAIRITHIPSGIVVECQNERSQHKNRARAMSLLKSKLLTLERDRQNMEQAKVRKLLVGSGDRSERIRTYNFPQGRVTDHRINLTLYKLANILEGNLDPIINPLVHEHRIMQLAELAK